MVTLVTWGIPSHRGKSDVAGGIRKGQILSAAPELLRYFLVLSRSSFVSESNPLYSNLDSGTCFPDKHFQPV
jgi:hypothetical protein